MKTVLATLNAKYIHMSLALRTLKAYSGREFEIELAEYTLKDPAMQIVADLFKRAPDVVGFSCYIWNIEETIPIIQMLKKIRPELCIVLGGPEVSYDTKYWMERVPEVDFIVMGEGEETFHHLLQQWSTATLHNQRDTQRHTQFHNRDSAETIASQGGKYHLVYGLAYRDRSGNVVINPARPKVRLDDLPSPHHFPEDMAQYPTRVVYFETSRGCPVSGPFCVSSIEVGVRYFDLERTKRDLLHLIQSGAKLIKFVDRTFNIRREYALEIFQFLIEHHGGACVFQFEITADIMRPEVIAYLSEHAPLGVFRFEIGVQSTNELTNEIIQRRQHFAKLSRTVTMIRDSGKIAQHLDLIAGLPEEDYDSFRRTFNDVFALRPEELQLGFLKMLRGTGLRARAEEYGYIYMDHAPYEILGNHVMPYSDMLRIKQAEDVLEKYWNAHRMDATMQYLLDHVFTSAFDFFQSFGAHWESRGWQRIGHQLEDLYTRLLDFLRASPIEEHLAVVEGLMKYDYFCQHTYRPRKIWWELSFSAQEHAYWMNYILQHQEDIFPDCLILTERELHKQVMVERTEFDLAKYMQNGTLDRNGSHLLIVTYRPNNEMPEVLTYPMAQVMN
jgi:anaerobic magnesium-protoporphyrin IX monomethyl ester cyclase